MNLQHKTANTDRRQLRKHYCRYKDGAELYSMGLTKFQELAKEAGATIKYQGCVLVDIDKIDEYLEGFRIY